MLLTFTYDFCKFVRKLKDMSNTKLTLSLNKTVIESAKEYAKEKGISLSKLIEIYLQKLTTDYQPEVNSTPIVDALTGIISLPDDFDYKETYADYLSKKYQ